MATIESLGLAKLSKDNLNEFLNMMQYDMLDTKQKVHKDKFIKEVFSALTYVFRRTTVADR